MSYAILRRLNRFRPGALFEGAGGLRPKGGLRPQGKRKKGKKEKKRRKERKKKKNGTMNKVKLLHIKCCFFKFFNSPLALKNKKICPPHKVEMTPLVQTVTTIGFCRNAKFHCLYCILF